MKYLILALLIITTPTLASLGDYPVLCLSTWFESSMPITKKVLDVKDIPEDGSKSLESPLLSKRLVERVKLSMLKTKMDLLRLSTPAS